MGASPAGPSASPPPPSGSPPGTTPRGEGRYICAVCGKRLSSKTNLRRHNNKLHGNGTKLVRCPERNCTASFLYDCQLKTHRDTVHLRLRPFSCSRCAKSYGTLGHLKEHVSLVHDKQRPFTCGSCGARCRTRGHLNLHHRLKHLALRPFGCEWPGCGRKFGYRSHLGRHERDVHGLVGGEAGANTDVAAAATAAAGAAAAGGGAASAASAAAATAAVTTPSGAAWRTPPTADAAPSGGMGDKRGGDGVQPMSDQREDERGDDAEPSPTDEDATLTEEEGWEKSMEEEEEEEELKEEPGADDGAGPSGAPAADGTGASLGRRRGKG
ncbi:hypothetical protein MMPV_008550 [Pyropia vietnamensis]